MRKRYITIIIAAMVLSAPAMYLKNTVFAQSNEGQSSEQAPLEDVKLAIHREAEEKRIAEEAAAKAAAEAEAARIEAERVAAEQAAQAAAAEAQRVAAEKAAADAAQAEAAKNCGPQDPAYIYRILTESGVPRESAIQQLGSWKTESGGDFNHCQKRGDSGVAWGLNSWHPGRRADMPETLKEQVLWAVHTEMKRDCSECYRVFMTPNVGQYAIRTAIQQSTRWGVEGARWTYANQFAQQF